MLAFITLLDLYLSVLDTSLCRGVVADFEYRLPVECERGLTVADVGKSLFLWLIDKEEPMPSVTGLHNSISASYFLAGSFIRRRIYIYLPKDIFKLSLKRAKPMHRYQLIEKLLINEKCLNLSITNVKNRRIHIYRANIRGIWISLLPTYLPCVYSNTSLTFHQRTFYQ